MRKKIFHLLWKGISFPKRFDYAIKTENKVVFTFSSSILEGAEIEGLLSKLLESFILNLRALLIIEQSVLQQPTERKNLSYFLVH